MRRRRRPDSPVPQMILDLLARRQASYHRPVASRELARALKLCPSYARELARLLVEEGWLGVRKGPGGGYYLRASVPASRPAGACGEPRREAGDGRCPAVDGLLRELEQLDSILSALEQAVAAEGGLAAGAVRASRWQRSLDELREHVQRVRAAVRCLCG